MTTSINPQEIKHFAKDSDHWWDEEGPFKPLHKLNPVRLSYIRSQICAHFNPEMQSLTPFKKLEILDIGCGGGLVCEPMARLGGNVTGIDADANAIEVAKNHARGHDLKITYKNIPAEQLKNTFDVVLALEIIEHVDNVDSFVQNCVDLCKPGGLIIISTPNRTPQSYALGIIAAEYLLRWVPRGTHQWKKFIRPSELSRMLRQAGAVPKDIKGLNYNVLKDEFKLSNSNISVNYFITTGKP
ncbi:MAG: bifunctional 3-demethylubiquinol 3-O-methyltransferase/2-polyprenyl-6-hydroxyphenol methylase [Alphaproteobacteria bacterium CG_4_9_14_3_um_filter_47_13]|nr:MAG: bifunctional 3-demethylubiquinol 3-O-methyltransferase/2-polyprenyl-6-hydroxyphenol methylase [Alphaproteobacteria bacterium CG_4_9_14_3_um_filter_47_13]